jgi:hypothetical protein
LAAFQVTNMHLSFRRIDLLHLMQDPHIDSIPLPELFRCTDNERLFLVDDPADIVGDSSGGKGGVRAPLEDNNIQFGPVTLCL